jgi:hypothetical protein
MAVDGGGRPVTAGSGRAGGEAKAPVVCCRSWTEQRATRRDEWPWQVVHQLAHSRVSFRLETFAELAKLPDKEAERIVREAQRLKWLWRPAKGVWVGQLRARR